MKKTQKIGDSARNYDGDGQPSLLGRPSFTPEEGYAQLLQQLAAADLAAEQTIWKKIPIKTASPETEEAKKRIRNEWRSGVSFLIRSILLNNVKYKKEWSDGIISCENGAAEKALEEAVTKLSESTQTPRENYYNILKYDKKTSLDIYKNALIETLRWANLPQNDYRLTMGEELLKQYDQLTAG